MEEEAEKLKEMQKQVEESIMSPTPAGLWLILHFFNFNWQRRAHTNHYVIVNFEKSGKSLFFFSLIPNSFTFFPILLLFFFVLYFYF